MAPPRPVSTPVSGNLRRAAGDKYGSLYLRSRPKVRAPPLYTLFDDHAEDILKSEKFEGFFNLSLILLVFSLMYIGAKNLSTHGVRFSPEADLLKPCVADQLGPLAVCVAFVYVVSLLVIVLVRSIGMRPAGRVHVALYWVIAAMLGLGGPWVIVHAPLGPFTRLMAIGNCLIVTLKTHSYFFMNLYFGLKARAQAAGEGGDHAGESPGAAEVAAVPHYPPVSPAVRPGGGEQGGSREGADGGDGGDADASGRGDVTPRGEKRLHYPDNLTLSNFCYFLVVPTLSYELNFPRQQQRVSLRRIARDMAAGLALLMMSMALTAQFVIPVTNPRRHHEALLSATGVHPDPLGTTVLTEPLDRILVYLLAEARLSSVDIFKLGVPSLLSWLCMFFGFFHFWLNAVAEATGFGDRQFYLDWWNTTTIGGFWQKWNTPVHVWCHRHVLTDTMHYWSLPREAALMLTFFLSAVLHEALLVVCFRQLSWGFFAGMLFQVPLVYLTNRFRGRRRGNLIMWVHLFLGQPLLELFYLRQYYETHESIMCEAQSGPQGPFAWLATLLPSGGGAPFLLSRGAEL